MATTITVVAGKVVINNQLSQVSPGSQLRGYIEDLMTAGEKLFISPAAKRAAGLNQNWPRLDPGKQTVH